MTLEKINSVQKFSSKYLVEQINIFRKEEGNQVELLHYSFLTKIENEFEYEIRHQNILVSQYEQKMPTGGVKMVKHYELDFEQALQILMSESKTVRKRCVEVMKAQQLEIDKLKQPSYQIENRIERAEAWIVEEKERIQLQESNKKLQFRSDFVDVCFDTDGLFSMEQVCKLLKLDFGRNTMLKTLREKGILTTSNTPMQKYVSNGYFKVIEEMVKNNSFNKLITTTFATQKGVGFIHKLLKIND